MNLFRFLAWICLPVLLAECASAQAPSLKFETVTIRSSITPTYEERMAGKVFMGLKIEGRQVTMGQMPLETMVAYAYDMKVNRVFAPKGADRIKFEVTATMPEGATKEQFPEMLREMLVARFDLKARREPRGLPGYVITIAESGHKLTRMPDEAPRKIAVGGNGEVEFTEAWDKLIHGFPGLSDRPIVDRTGLSGVYSGVLPAVQTRARATGEDPMMRALREGWAAVGIIWEPRDTPQDVVVVEHLETYPSDK